MEYELHKDYWCVYLTIDPLKFNKSPRFKVNMKPFRFRKIPKVLVDVAYTEWEFPDNNVDLTNKNIRNLITQSFKKFYIDGSGIVICENEEDAIKCYDDKILAIADRVTTDKRANLYKQLIVKRKVEINIFEKNAMIWYNSLNDEEKEYVSFFKYKYEDLP